MSKKLFIAALVLLGLVAVLGVIRDKPPETASLGVMAAVTPPPNTRDPHNHGFNANEDSWVYNGYDITLYSDANKATQKIRLEGSQGIITTTHLVVTNGLTVTNLVSTSNGLASTNGLDIVGNITMTNGSILNTKGAVTVTDQLDVSSEINARNGVNVTGNITVGTDLDVAGNIVSTSGNVRINDGTLVTGTFNVTGIATFNAASRADSLWTTANGLAAAGGITSTGVLTVTSWGQFYGVALLPAITQVVSGSYGITPTTYSMMYLLDDGTGNQASTLSAVTSIVTGTYQGQILMLMWVDQDGATLIIKNHANTSLSGDITLGISDTLTLFWNGYDWTELAASNNS